jgi:hypothetical protein
MMRIVLVLAFGVTLAAPSFAGTVVQRKGPAELEVRCDGAGQDIALADLIAVTLTVEGCPGLDVQAPLDMGSAPWLVIKRDVPTREEIGPGRVRWQIQYRFAPREPGKLAFTLLPVKVRDGNAEQAVSFDPIPFTVTTAAGELKPITGIETVPPIVARDMTWLLLTALAASILGLAVLLLVLRRLMRPSVSRTPAEHALHELDRLLAMGLPQCGRSERFITLLTTVVRRYVERQFGLPARRQTTPEFLRSLAKSPALTPSQKQFLHDFLERCEAVKFAGVAMAPGECDKLAKSARQFLEAGLTGQAGQTLPQAKIAEDG